MIKILNITKKYGGHFALDAVNIQVDKGELFGVIGPDGAGKTTLFRLVTSLLVPDDGTIIVNGYDTVEDYRSIRKIIGYMPGRFSLYHDLSVEENLRFYATVFGTTVEENYDLVRDIYSHIEPFRNRLAGKLSGGMKQKLALSCALIHRPEILVLDEPTTGVDAVSRKEFWEMLKRIQNEGITILVSTPYMDEAQLCDRVAFLQEGKIMAVNTPQGIINDYPRELFALRAKDIYKLVLDLKSYHGTHTSLLFGHEIHYTERSKSIDHEQLMRYLEEKGHGEIIIEKIEPGIEDSFLEYMRES